MKVFVYYNLHRKLWSVRALEGPNKGRVVSHEYQVFLENCTFKVSAAGNARVRREGRKNVHAGVVGHWDGSYPEFPLHCCPEKVQVTYNPYKHTTFVEVESEKPIHTSQFTVLSFGRYVSTWGKINENS
jgi:hypothetical protein